MPQSIQEISENGKDYLLLENGQKLPYWGEQRNATAGAFLAKETDTVKIADFKQSNSQEIRIPFSELQKSDPERAALIQNSVNKANKFSDQDKNISGIDYVIISKGNLDEGMRVDTATRIDGKLESTVKLSSESFKHLDNPKVQAGVEHEAGHAIMANSEHETRKPTSSKAQENLAARKEELWADRYANSSGTLDSHLTNMQRTGGASYDFPSDNEVVDHPNDRERIKANLTKQYGDEIFKNSGSYEGNGEFKPSRDKYGIPITENGERVTNWDSKIKPAIDKQVDSDLKMLDKMKNDENGISDKDKAQFKQHISESVESFKREHKPEYQGAEAGKTSANVDDKQQNLVDSFRNGDIHDQAAREQNIAQDPNMAKAYVAYYLADRQIQNSGLSDSAKQEVSYIVRDNIANGLERGEYPNVQRTETVANQEQSQPAHSQERQHTEPAATA